jgi:hypothetical protein
VASWAPCRAVRVYLLVFLVLPFANVALLSVYLHSPTKIAVAEFTGANYASF